MTDEPLTDDDLDRVREGRTRPSPEPACGGCGVPPRWDEDTFMWHYWHSDDCPVAAHIREMVDSGAWQGKTE